MKKLRIQAPRFLCFSSDQRFHFNMTSEKHLARPTSPGQVDLPLGNSWLGDRGDQPVGTKHERAINLCNHWDSLWLLLFVSSKQSSINPGDWPSTTTTTSTFKSSIMFIQPNVHYCIATHLCTTLGNTLAKIKSNGQKICLSFHTPFSSFLSL